MNRHLLKILLVTGVIGALALGGAAVAQADNPDLSVSLSLTSSGSDPARATVGDTITVNASVASNLSKPGHALVTLSLSKDGAEVYTIARRVLLVPGKDYALSASFPVLEGTAPGAYTATLTAANGNGESSATASLEIY